jgi:hypothetical protein
LTFGESWATISALSPRADLLSNAPSPVLSILKKELALLAVLLFFGIAILPIAVWFVGDVVFGTYQGNGRAGFFGDLGNKLRSGDPAAWFLVVSPWLGVQIVRLAALGWRRTAKS